MERGEPSNTVGGDVNWYSCYGGQCGGPLKNSTYSYSVIQHFHPLGIHPEKKENSNLKNYMHPSVHSSTVYNSQNVDTTSESIHR